MARTFVGWARPAPGARAAAALLWGWHAGGCAQASPLGEAERFVMMTARASLGVIPAGTEARRPQGWADWGALGTESGTHPGGWPRSTSSCFMDLCKWGTPEGSFGPSIHTLPGAPGLQIRHMILLRGLSPAPAPFILPVAPLLFTPAAGPFLFPFVPLPLHTEPLVSYSTAYPTLLSFEFKRAVLFLHSVRHRKRNSL